MLKLTCGPVTARVYWSDSPKGWIAEVALLNVHSSQPLISDPDTAKNTAIILARDLCKQNNVDVPACLDNPVWISN